MNSVHAKGLSGDTGMNFIAQTSALGVLVLAAGFSFAQQNVAAVNLVSPGQGKGSGASEGSASTQTPPSDHELESCIQEIDSLRKEQAILLTVAQDDEGKKKIEIMQKQIETL